MPSQQIEIAETITALKRALKRNGRPASSVPISQASNRGNKLKRGAQYVHQGALAYIKGPEVYKEKIDHAGYARYILDRNPDKLDEYGDELVGSESDGEIDPSTADENAYSGLKLEELLCPLRHPSELPSHPTLSAPYLSKALPDMLKTTTEQVNREKEHLWRAKDLHRQLLGDEAWIPCETVETPDDWDIFEPKWRPPGSELNHGKKRKREGDPREDAPSVTSTSVIPNIVESMPSAVPSEDLVRDAEMGVVDSQNNPEATTNGQSADDHANSNNGASSKPPVAEVPTTADPTPLDTEIEKVADKAASTDRAVQGEQGDQSAATNDKPREPEEGADDGTGVQDTKETTAPETSKEQDKVKDEQQDGDTTMNDDPAPAIGEATSRSASRSPSASPSPPPRRITRALAQTNNPEEGEGSNGPTPPLSPTPSTSLTDLSIAPLYLIPTLRPPPTKISPYHLPMGEHSETLQLLTQYIQKQSAFISTLETVLARLLQADRLRRTVFHWCKAEGHVDEMSDGEDWIDEESWGLEKGELKKGQGDEEDLVAEGEYLRRRKGKRRRGGG